MNKIIIAILLVLYPTHCLSDQVVVPLTKGDVAPFTGFLFTPDKEKELRLLDQTVTYYKSYNESLGNINKAQVNDLAILEQRVQIRDQQIGNLEKRIQDNDTGFLTKAGYFIFGAVVTGLLAQAIYRTR